MNQDLVVSGQISLSLETMRRFFHAEREVHGPFTPIGHRYSNLIEQTKNYFFSQSPTQREHLKFFIARSVMEIRDLKHQRAIPPRSEETLLLEFMPETAQ